MPSALAAELQAGLGLNFAFLSGSLARNLRSRRVAVVSAARARRGHAGSGGRRLVPSYRHGDAGYQPQTRPTNPDSQSAVCLTATVPQPDFLASGIGRPLNHQRYTVNAFKLK